jgi:hypothetical protein
VVNSRYTYYSAFSYVHCFLKQTFFQGNRKAFKKLNIDFYVLQGNSKAFVSENFIRITKARMYRSLRANFSVSWEKTLPYIVAGINNTPSPALGGYTAESLNSPSQDPITREVRRQGELNRKEDKKVVAKEYEIGQFVYVDFPDVPFMKSFDFARGMAYKVAAVDAASTPYLYTIEELNGKRLKQKYYAWQLNPATDPDKTTLPIEAVIDTRGSGRNAELLVKWLHYDNSYVRIALSVQYLTCDCYLSFQNSWIPKKSLVK